MAISKFFGRIGMLLALLGCAVPSMARQLPVEDFFRNAKFSQLQLSPDGSHLAALVPYKGRRNILVMQTDDLSKAKLATKLSKSDIASFFWANDKRLIFTMDKDGTEAFGLFGVDSDGSHADLLVKPQVSIGGQSIRFARVVDRLRHDPDHVVISYNKRRVSAPDLYKMSVRSGKLTMLKRNSGKDVSSVLDRAGRVRVVSKLDGLVQTIDYRADDDKEWEQVINQSALDEGIVPLAFDYDNNTFYVASNKGRDRLAIYRYDLETGKLGDMLYADGTYDVVQPLFSYAEKKLIGFAFEAERPVIKYTDPAWAALQAGLEKAFPGKLVAVTSTSDDEQLAVVFVYSDTDPGRYYLLDRRKGQVHFLAATRDWIDPADMNEMQSVTFKSRDGLTLHGYLTVPKEAKGSKVPLIINPHGGPFGIRDSWGFNPDHQFFANRGYAVLQVNFRGSGGYGHAFEKAGYGEWGRKMQDDISDAVRWAIDEGIADPGKICIYGASYGGYAAVAGLAFTPELYQCGIDYVGVTDVGLLFETMPDHWELQRKVLEKQIGDPDDETFVKAISPLYHTDKIRAPVLIIHGKRDPRVNLKHATYLRDKLSAQGKSHEWLLKNNEGHGFRKEENRIEAYKKIEAFLAKHLN